MLAVAAVTTGGFSPGWAVLRFVTSAAGGAAPGALVAAAVRAGRRFLHDPLLATTVSLATPFTAYLLGDSAHVSAVLAVVVAGLLIGHETPRSMSGSGRLQVRAVWRLIDFLLESFVFLLIGQQLPLVVRGLSAYSTATLVGAASLTLGGVLLVRPAWLLATLWLPGALRARRDRPANGADGPVRHVTGKDVLALSWAGTRGVITLTSMLTLPLTTEAGDPFPLRDLLLFCAYLVVVVTLVGQGVSFAPLIRRLHLPGDPDPTHLHRRARAAAALAALERLDDIALAHGLDPDAVEQLRQALLLRRSTTSDDEPAPPSSSGAAVLAAQRDVLDAEREELVRWRHIGRLSDDSLRALQAELDHEESVTMLRGTV